MKQLITATFLTLILVGCGSVAVENQRDAALMPEPIAKKVLIKYFGEHWVAQPRGRYTQGFGKMCGNDGWGDLPLNEINVVRTFQDGKVLMLTKTDWLKVAIPCTQLAYEVSGKFSRDDIKDIVDALVSLGAKIEQQ